MVVEA
ncbi:hypothetical protein LINGRAHAP2_LOCUS1697 [Linum grandiflorum]